MRNNSKIKQVYLSILVASTPVVLAETPAQIDRLTQQWLDIDRQSSHLQASWIDQKPLLNQRLALLEAERHQLQNVLSQNTANDSDVESRRAELLSDQTALEQQQNQMTQSLSLLLSQLQAMMSKLPPVLADSWQVEQANLDEPAAPSQQLQIALAKLSQAASFDQRITVHEGAITNKEGQTILVKQLYLGLGMAWFTSRDGNHAGWGQADQTHWNWHFDESINANEVHKAIAIYEKQQPADMVRLPIHVVPIATSPSLSGAPQ